MAIRIVSYSKIDGDLMVTSTTCLRQLANVLLVTLGVFFIATSSFANQLYCEKGKRLDTSESFDYAFTAQLWFETRQTLWGMTILPTGEHLYTTKAGSLLLADCENGRISTIQNTPEIREHGQGGLLDVALNPFQLEQGWVYLAYADRKYIDGEYRYMTKVVRGKINNGVWGQQQTLFEAKLQHYTTSGHHFGSRIVFDKNDNLYFSIGDRGKQNTAQQLDVPNGKIMRIALDGSVPADNPMLSESYPQIFSYGHRNPQGLYFDVDSESLYAVEHGAKGGDEFNLVAAGKNYGWPEVTFGVNYNGTAISDYTDKPNMVPPLFFWRPSIAVSSLVRYQGDAFSKWQDDFLVASLRNRELRHLTFREGRVLHDEIIYTAKGRIRDMKVDGEGNIFLVLNAPNQVLWLKPTM